MFVAIIIAPLFLLLAHGTSFSSAAILQSQASISWFSDKSCTTLSSSQSSNPMVWDVNTCSTALSEPSLPFNFHFKIESCGAIANVKIFVDPSCSTDIFPDAFPIPCGICLPNPGITDSGSFRLDCGSSQIPPGKRVVTDLLTYSDQKCSSSLNPSNRKPITSDSCSPFPYYDLEPIYATAASCASDGAAISLHRDPGCKDGALAAVYGPANTCVNNQFPLFVNFSNAPGFSAYKLACSLDTTEQASKAGLIAGIVILSIWIINFGGIIFAARACSFNMIHFAICAVLLGPFAWIAVCVHLRQLPPGRVSALSSPFRQVVDDGPAFCNCCCCLQIKQVFVLFDVFHVTHAAAGFLGARQRKPRQVSRW
jgi:hypothetical protein